MKAPSRENIHYIWRPHVAEFVTAVLLCQKHNLSAGEMHDGIVGLPTHIAALQVESGDLRTG